MTNAKLYAYVVGQPWAVRPEVLDAAMQIIARDRESDRPAPEMVEARRGKRPDGTWDAQVRDGVGIVPVQGPIFRYADFFTLMCGGATVETLARDLAILVEDPAVHTILLNIDSPGGQANGIAEFAEAVRAANDRKPVVAYVGGDGCSAAYWIACAAPEIVMHASAEVGSIGVVMAYPTPRTDGKSIEFVSSVSPDKRPNVNTEKGRAVVQRAVDDLGDLFVSTVARYRGVSADKVLSDFGRGGYLIGAKALKAGMVDSLGTYEGTLARLVEAGGKRPEPTSASRPHASKGPTMSKKTSFFSRYFKARLAEDDVEDIDVDEVLQVAAASGAVGTARLAELAEPLKPRRAVVAKSGEAEDDEDDVTESPQYKALAARLEKAEAAAKAQDEVRAEAFAAGLVKAGRLMPKGKEAAKTLHLQAARDDRERPLAEGSRVASLGAMVEGLPAHSLTRELAASDLPASARVVGDLPADGDSKLDVERLAELAAMTPLGEAALAKLAARSRA